MITAATPNRERTTTAPSLYVAFELSNRAWKLGSTIGLGQKPREQDIAARDLEQLDQAIATAKKQFGLPSSAIVATIIQRSFACSQYSSF